MCGLVGVAGVIFTKDVDVFNELLYVDRLRGKDSTGVGSANETTGVIKTFKGVLNAEDLISHKQYPLVVSSQTKVLMGHNRAMTRGGATNHNAHPFTSENILMAHNGTLDHGCLSDLPDNVEGQTDSERLMLEISTNGGNIGEAIGKVSGAWALSVYNKADNTISLVRNDKRPLFYTMSESKKTLYWASEAHMLHLVLIRNGIKYGKVYDLAVDRVKTWTLPKASEIFGDAGGEKAEGKKPVNFPRDDLPWEGYSRGPYSGHQGSRTNSGGNTGGTNNGTTWRAGLKIQPEDYDKWAVYGEGWQAAEDGLLSTSCPYQYATLARESWLEGHKDGREWAGKENKKREADPKRTEEQTAADKVVDLDSKRTTIYDKRSGPNNTKIGRGDFRTLTNHECGYCSDPVTFEDKGFFHMFDGKPAFFCESCVTNQTTDTVKPVQQQA